MKLEISKTSWAAAVLFGTLFFEESANAQKVPSPSELSEELLKRELRKNPAEFETVEWKKEGATPFSIKLGEPALETAEGFFLDGFRITAPEKIEEGTDFIWFFNGPKSWGQWYIMPMSEEPKPGFSRWFDGDKIFTPYDVAGEEGRQRILQSLDGSYFVPGNEYLIWFNKTNDDETGRPLSGAMSFSKKPEGDWDGESIESALALKPHGAAEQVKQLDSRGGRILLDPDFFRNSYAKNRIDGLFFSIRETVHMQSGFFIQMQTQIPTSGTNPRLADIRAKYGEPDFIERASDRRARFREEEKADGEDGDETDTIYFYDFFGMEVDPADPEKRVQRVISQSSDFSALVPDEVEGLTFGRIAIKNLVAFHDDGKEVGRLLFFLEPGKEPVVITDPPAGIYRSSPFRELEYFGNGKWEERTFFEGKKTARTVRYEGHLMNGLAEGFQEDGKPTFRANYKNGELHGKLETFAEDGSPEPVRFFEDGKPVEAEPEE